MSVSRRPMASESNRDLIKGDSTAKRTGTLIRDNRFRLHSGYGRHPESPERLNGIETALLHSGMLDGLSMLVPEPADEERLLDVHGPEYIENLSKLAKKAQEQNCLIDLDADTYLNPRSYEVARLAAGGCLSGVDSLLQREVFFSFALVRPPGHHAVAGSAMGFCLFNNIALAAKYAKKRLGCKRVVILDWDVHHGNGTQDIFYSDPSVLFISLHGYPLYPGTGWFTEAGSDDGKGYNINIPLPAGTGDQGYLKAWERIVEPVVREYQPDLVMLSAGYDAHQADPLGNQQVSTFGYSEMSRRLVDLAMDCNAKIFATLEGGYDVEALGKSVAATIGEFKGAPIDLACQSLSTDEHPQQVEDRLGELVKYYRSMWSNLR